MAVTSHSELSSQPCSLGFLWEKISPVSHFISCLPAIPLTHRYRQIDHSLLAALIFISFIYVLVAGVESQGLGHANNYFAGELLLSLGERQTVRCLF